MFFKWKLQALLLQERQFYYFLITTWYMFRAYMPFTHFASSSRNVFSYKLCIFKFYNFLNNHPTTVSFLMCSLKPLIKINWFLIFIVICISILTYLIFFPHSYSILSRSLLIWGQKVYLFVFMSLRNLEHCRQSINEILCT